MNISVATRVAAVAIGLSLAGGMAFAAPDDRRGRDQNTGAEQRDQDDQNDRARTRRNNQGQGANQNRRGRPDFGPPNNNRQRGIERSRNRYDRDRNARGRDNWQFDNRNRDNRRNFGDRDNRRDWNDRNRRQHVNIQQYRRNFNAPRRYNVGVYRWRDGYSYRRYSYGQHLPRYFFARNFWLVNFFAYGLFAPPPGYVWVRYGPDALLIDVYTGEIVQVRYNMFY